MRTDDNTLFISNTFGIEAVAREAADYSDVESLRQLLADHRSLSPRLPVLNVGEGSNLLFTTPFVERFVLRTADNGQEPVVRGCRVTAWAGMKMDRLIEWTVERGLYGLENLSWIPGTVGASAVQNIGAYGAEVGRCIDSVECLNSATLERREFSRDECQYAYRDSVFKREREWIVTSVTFRLDTVFTPNIAYGGLAKELGDGSPVTAQRVREAVIRMRRDKLPDPAVEGNAGSFFMNPIVSRERFEEIAGRYDNAPHYPAPDGCVKLSAAWLIEQAGWKGRSIGRAGVSGKHALIIVNHGGATGADIVAVCRAVQDAVRRQFGIDLKPEVNFI